MKVLLDTSALIKRYKPEAGGRAVHDWLARADQVVLAAHCQMEIASAFLRDVHAGLLPLAEFEQGMADVAADFQEFEVLPISPLIEHHASAAMRRTPLGVQDALHIGTAQSAGVDMFITADQRQADAALGAGLPTELVPA